MYWCSLYRTYRQTHRGLYTKCCLQSAIISKDDTALSVCTSTSNKFVVSKSAPSYSFLRGIYGAVVYDAGSKVSVGAPSMITVSLAASALVVMAQITSFIS